MWGGGKKQPVYTYPRNIISPGHIGKFIKVLDKRIEIPDNECSFCRRIDSQIAKKKVIFGGGYLVSDRIAQLLDDTQKERVQSGHVWELSDREKQIIKQLNQNKQK